MTVLTDHRLAGKLEDYRRALLEELRSVLSYWLKYSQDNKGGFYGSVNWNNMPDADAAKGIVMFSRICWAFSAAYNFNQIQEYLDAARKAYEYIRDYFVDNEFGGVYWSLDADGKMLEGKKQIYGQAFCIYALAEYYKIAEDICALDLAKDLFRQVEQYSFDKLHNGYIEALSRNWTEAPDLRLSDKDENERKSANTHLHIIEAYANLYTVWQNEALRQRIQNLLDIFIEHIIDKSNHHLILFFDDKWNRKSQLLSFGHDIEAAWLLTHCEELIREETIINQFKKISIQLVNAAMKGLDEKDGGLWYEYDEAAKHWIREKHWWPQAEAMIGFFTAWEITEDQYYLDQSVKVWEFVRSYLIDKQSGEWFWGIYEDYSVIPKEKAGFWKCPYHNGRACLELIRRIAIHIQTR